MCLAEGPQRSDAGEARTRGPSVSSQALRGSKGGPDLLPPPSSGSAHVYGVANGPMFL